MGKDRRGWRKLVKKLRRKTKRQQIAQLRLKEESHHLEECDKEDVACETRENGFDEDDEDSVDSTFFLSHLRMEEREHQADLACAMKKQRKKGWRKLKPEIREKSKKNGK
ncbi:hypothetical protein Ocin01_10699 [Orchesella cincta]|uniref:Uncharacterized protein n=1 Tax=Orchesella cincta TaxID=48709 RepID=A0A1D2MSS6_ORCCI|nr:hypothetical protein Ocin01_10699 [Orchesella cincta]